MKKSLLLLTAVLSILRAQAQTLNTALDAPGLAWTTGGNAVWTGQTAVTHDGVDAAQSGKGEGSFESWLQTTITGPGSLSFWWKQASATTFASSLRIEMGGTVLDYLLGEVDWHPASFFIPAGSQTLRWVYLNGDTGQGFLDQVQFEPGTLPTFVRPT